MIPSHPARLLHCAVLPRLLVCSFWYTSSPPHEAPPHWLQLLLLHLHSVKQSSLSHSLLQSSPPHWLFLVLVRSSAPMIPSHPARLLHCAVLPRLLVCSFWYTSSPPHEAPPRWPQLLLLHLHSVKRSSLSHSLLQSSPPHEAPLQLPSCYRLHTALQLDPRPRDWLLR